MRDKMSNITHNSTEPHVDEQNLIWWNASKLQLTIIPDWSAPHWKSPGGGGGGGIREQKKTWIGFFYRHVPTFQKKKEGDLYKNNKPLILTKNNKTNNKPQQFITVHNQRPVTGMYSQPGETIQI